ncbi:pleiotropic drug resistance protein 1 [Cryptomeria japonica]|uniref:pleiotropic drug resistance protein 1 n=1 Tax=Cryptomeria japonica TaxID=3369 RepID=UPI0027DA730E|nr:pleiotropic drug resistance protein 1 [Cryptomeria japonica]
MAASIPLEGERVIGLTWTGSLRSGSTRLFESSSSVFGSQHQQKEDDEEALKWAALEKLPTYDRIRTSIFKQLEGEDEVLHQIDVRNMELGTRQQLLDRLVKAADQDNGPFLHKLRERIDRVGINLPEIEVRFENLNVGVDAYIGSRALPTLFNYTANMAESLLESLRLCRSNKKTMTILKDVSGIIKPGRMTLLLGPPGAGKTTLLLALSGKLGSTLRVRGEVTYNGSKMDEFVAQRTSAYISQHDLHIAEMTVRETLDFSARCQGVGERYDVLSELSRREKELGIKPDLDIDVFMKAAAMKGQRSSMVTDYVLKILGLDICGDTLVGDNMTRGISGGQKKRVTTGEMIVGPAKAFFMDEISTGLDSSTTFQIVQCLRQIVHVYNTTMVISLLQPAPETFDLFDDVILLSEGQLLYQGPRELIVKFFESMGFACPERKGVADFLQEVTSRKDQEQYWTRESQIYRYVPVKEFADAFQSFKVGVELNTQLAIPYDKSKSHPTALTTKEYGLGNMELIKACIDREILLMKRSSFIYIFKLFQITTTALITLTVFFRTEMHDRDIVDASVYYGALFYTLVNIMFNGFVELSITITRLPVFYKQRDSKLYPAWAYSLPTWVMRVPLSLMESSIWVILTYYTIGFDPNPNRFFRQFFLLFILHQMSLSLFRFIAAVGRSQIVANTFGTFALLIVLVLGGFIVSRDDIKPWWIWGYWASPLMYAQNAIAVVEFLANRWQKVRIGPGNNIGTTLLESRGLFAESYWYWMAIGVLVGYAIIFNLLYTLALAYLDPLGRPQALIPEGVEESQGDRQAPQEMKTISSVGSKKGMVLPFQPLSMAFENVSYFVDMPAEMKQQGVTEDRLQLLREVSGSFRPGVLTCLMGVSGAGKTTLMDVLAGRKTGGYIEGSITISGYPKQQQTFARISGYCEQNDIHSPYVTVYESLVYSAWLRLPKEVDSQARKAFVDEVMELVELNNLRESLVGLPGVNGLSTEQRKRLTIAVELVANPSIIFMDEPTSGLDARAAAIVMRTVRNTVDTGRTVVCTIHQPSIDIFEAFDELVLMKRGGRMIYVGLLGRHSQTLIDYFQSIKGVPDITPGYNPATWMLEVTSVGSEMRLGVDFADIYRSSSLYKQNQDLIKEISTPAPGSQDLYFESQFSQPFLIQTEACLWKQHLSYWRNPQYNVIRFFFTLVCALLFGTIFWKMGSKIKKQQDVLNAMGSMFAAIVFIGVNNASSIQPVVEVERTVFYREKAAGMYSPLPYAFAQILIELPYVFLQSVMYGLIVYAMIDFNWITAKFFWFFFFMFFTFLYHTYYGMMTVAITPNATTAAIVSSAFYGIWMLFSGFLITRPKIPMWWRWYYWACPYAWTLYGLITSQYGDITNLMTKAGSEEQEPLHQFLESYFGFKHDFLGPVAVVIVGFVLLFAFIFAWAIRSNNFQSR